MFVFEYSLAERSYRDRSTLLVVSLCAEPCTSTLGSFPKKRMSPEIPGLLLLCSKYSCSMHRAVPFAYISRTHNLQLNFVNPLGVLSVVRLCVKNPTVLGKFPIVSGWCLHCAVKHHTMLSSAFSIAILERKKKEKPLDRALHAGDRALSIHPRSLISRVWLGSVSIDYA